MRDTSEKDADITRPVVLIGAGIGGLACALRLAAAGHRVIVLERAATPGGKMRTVPSIVGPIDAGPTVLTMRDVFDDLFTAAGLTLDHHLTLRADPVLARHWWSDGSTLDLHSDQGKNRAAIGKLAAVSQMDFETFDHETAHLYEMFEQSVMRAPSLSLLQLVHTVLRRLPALARGPLTSRSLSGFLKRRFHDPRLRQLFGRYATYVGGSPLRAPALLGLIWQAEARGVWSIEGGLHRLAQTIADHAEALGAEFRYGTHVTEIITQNGHVAGIRCADGTVVETAHVVFNGDPAALQRGYLGDAVRDAVAMRAVTPHSLSACVWSFAATPRGRDLIHHNVFFGDDPESEFHDLDRMRLPRDPTFYICAQDRSAGLASAPVERFEIIMNAPAGAVLNDEERKRCHDLMLQRLERMGLSFDPLPDPQAMTTPQDFARMFPGSDGSLYGRSPHGMAASFARPVARSRIAGLYLAGGGVHPGPGIPMAALSGKHAAEAIASDLSSTSTCRPMATPGGMSTG